ncbi:cell division suppressor protein YneA [Salipaludibacillus aurantiacus]|uniref:LysM domain-containing protein n=1 Tax=Salipaludibacillus aurantiacus TaxID=1601833 RepID=A0A1H9QFI8_9BACI|nr:LysM peptidoglycan-binding domain-containing protein [Salipaludibacillus aurantiacus]SER58629.1 LysM domain-containing protein [Salipaludibacillus aurantiacus]
MTKFLKNYVDGSMLILLLSVILFSWTLFSEDEKQAEDFYIDSQWTVSEGESLWAIARSATEEMDLTIEEAIVWIKSANNLEDEEIFPGQKLAVPGELKGVATE